MAELKPCPFCGTPYPYITFERGYIDDSAVVFCNNCKVSVKVEENDQEGFNDETRRRAIAAWNRRAEPTQEETTKEIARFVAKSTWNRRADNGEP